MCKKIIYEIKSKEHNFIVNVKKSMNRLIFAVKLRKHN